MAFIEMIVALILALNLAGGVCLMLDLLFDEDDDDIWKDGGSDEG